MIPISLSLFDGAMTTISTFNLIVVNNPPVFTQPLIDQTLNIGSSITYQIPPAIDPEGNSPVIVTFSALPSFAFF